MEIGTGNEITVENGTCTFRTYDLTFTEKGIACVLLDDWRRAYHLNLLWLIAGLWPAVIAETIVKAISRKRTRRNREAYAGLSLEEKLGKSELSFVIGRNNIEKIKHSGGKVIVFTDQKKYKFGFPRIKDYKNEVKGYLDSYNGQAK